MEMAIKKACVRLLSNVFGGEYKARRVTRRHQQYDAKCKSRLHNSGIKHGLRQRTTSDKYVSPTPRVRGVLNSNAHAESYFADLTSRTASDATGRSVSAAFHLRNSKRHLVFVSRTSMFCLTMSCDQGPAIVPIRRLSLDRRALSSNESTTRCGATFCSVFSCPTNQRASTCLFWTRHSTPLPMPLLPIATTLAHCRRLVKI
jgi:hypothetical protein